MGKHTSDFKSKIQTETVFKGESEHIRPTHFTEKTHKDSVDAMMVRLPEQFAAEVSNSLIIIFFFTFFIFSLLLKIDMFLAR